MDSISIIHGKAWLLPRDGKQARNTLSHDVGYLNKIGTLNSVAQEREREREREKKRDIEIRMREDAAIRRRWESRLGRSVGMVRAAMRKRVIRVELRFMVEQTEITELRGRRREPKGLWG